MRHNNRKPDIYEKEEAAKRKLASILHQTLINMDAVDIDSLKYRDEEAARKLYFEIQKFEQSIK